LEPAVGNYQAPDAVAPSVGDAIPPGGHKTDCIPCAAAFRAPAPANDDSRVPPPAPEDAPHPACAPTGGAARDLAPADGHVPDPP